MAEDESADDDLTAYVQSVVGEIIRPQTGSATFIRRCFTSMEDIKKWLKSLAERLSGASVIAPGQQQDTLEMIEYQRVSLVKQHESLGVIAFYLGKHKNDGTGQEQDKTAGLADFELVLNTLRKADKYDNLLREFPFN